MLIRFAFSRGAAETSEALESRVPDGIVADLDRHYDEDDGDAYLDLYYPEQPGSGTGRMPVVVWVHGGAWISGDKRDVANYLRILASKGMVTVGVGYSIAPEAKYPTPVEQVNAALGYLRRQSGELGIDPGRLVLAGDSAGSQIASQVALLTRDSGYAEAVGIEPQIKPDQLKAILLNCGAYDLGLANGSGLEGWFLKTALWAYSGSRDFRDDPRFTYASITERVNDRFPPSFITAGNDDPLLPHSEGLARRLEEVDVTVDALFFAGELEPGLGHEYQFDLDRPEGREALNRMVRFVREQA